MQSEQMLYKKLKDLLQEKDPNITPVKFNQKARSTDQKEFDIFLQNTVKQYILALEFVKVLEQNLQTPIKKDKFQKILQAEKKVSKNCKLSKMLQNFDDKSMKTIKYLSDVECDHWNKQWDLPTKTKRLVDEYNLYRSFMIATAAEKQNKQLEGQQGIYYKKYLKIKKQLQSKNQLLFYTFDAIQKYKNNSLIINSVIKKYLAPVNNVSNGAYLKQNEAQIQKIVSSFIQYRNDFLHIQDDLKMLIQPIKKGRKTLDPYVFRSKVKNQGVAKLFRELIGELHTMCNEMAQKMKANSEKKETILQSFSYTPKYGVKYNSLVDFVNFLYNTIFAAEQQALTKKMDIIKEHILRQKQESPQQYSLRVQSYMQQSRCHILNQTVRETIEPLATQVNQLKQQNKQLSQILGSILGQFDKKIESTLTDDIKKNIDIFRAASLDISVFLSSARNKEETEKAFNTPEQTASKQEVQQDPRFSLSSDVQYWRGEYEQLQQSLQTKQILIKQLESQSAQRKQHAQGDKSELQQRNMKLRQKLQKLEQELASRQNQVNLMAKNVDQMKKYLSIAAKQKQDQTTKLQQQNRRVTQLEDKLRKQQELCNKLTAEKTAFQIALQKSKNSYQELKKEYYIKHSQLVQQKNVQDLKHLENAQRQRQLIREHENELRLAIQAKSNQYQASLEQLKESYQHKLQDLNQEAKKYMTQVDEWRTKYYATFTANSVSRIDQEQATKNHRQQLARLQMEFHQKLEKETQYFRSRQQSLKKQINSLQDQSELYYYRENQKLKEIEKILQEKIQILNQLSAANQKIEQLQKENAQLVNNSRAIQKSFIRHTNSNEAVDESIAQILTTLYKDNVPRLLVSYTKALFNEDIFEFDQINKQVLVQHIESYAGSKIARTKLVYKYDTRNKVNFHHFIDNVPGLTLVIKTKNAIIAGFYPDVLKDKEILNKGGLLVSVTNNSSYTLYTRKPGDNNKVIYRGMIYDTFFAIYGNAQIRIKTGFKTVFSNFGVSNGYFNNRGDKVEKFLNEGEKREVEFEFCEFYQVIFEKDISLK